MTRKKVRKPRTAVDHRSQMKEGFWLVSVAGDNIDPVWWVYQDRLDADLKYVSLALEILGKDPSNKDVPFLKLVISGDWRAAAKEWRIKNLGDEHGVDIIVMPVNSEHVKHTKLRERAQKMYTSWALTKQR